MYHPCCLYHVPPLAVGLIDSRGAFLIGLSLPISGKKPSDDPVFCTLIDIGRLRKQACLQGREVCQGIYAKQNGGIEQVIYSAPWGSEPLEPLPANTTW